jgi:hypothetical protein
LLTPANLKTFAIIYTYFVGLCKSYKHL